MLKPSLALLIAISSLFAVLPGPAAIAGDKAPDCMAVFQTNQSKIEALALQRKTEAIQGIFRQAGCASPSVSLPSRRAPSQAAKIRCRFKLLPPSIICTF